MLNVRDLYCAPQTVLDILADMKMHESGTLPKNFFLDKSKLEATPSYVSFADGNPLEVNASTGNAKVSKPSRVAVIPIKGMMQRKFSMFYHAASTEYIRAQIALANSMPDIRAIVLDITSGGGTVSGTYELAEAIRKSNKPVIAAITDLGASAAYWAAAAASEIYVTNPLTQTGSIGAITQHQDVSKYLEKEGVKITFITSDNAEAKAYGNFATELGTKALESIKRSLNDAEKHFHSSIKRSRTSLDTEAAFTGEVFSADVARDIGLIDGVKTMNRVLSRALTVGTKAHTEKRSKVKSNKAMNDNIFAEFLPKETVAITENVTLTPERAKALYTALDTFRAKASSAEGELETLKESADAANKTIEQLEAKVTDAEAQVTTANTTIETLEAAATATNEEIVALKATITTLEETAVASDSELATQLETANAALETATTDLAAANTATEQATTVIEDLNGQIETLNASVEAKGTEIDEIKGQLADNVIEYNKLAASYGARNRAAINTPSAASKEADKDNTDEYRSKADKAVAERTLDALFELKGINASAFIN